MEGGGPGCGCFVSFFIFEFHEVLGLEILIKASTLLIILSGYLTHQTGLAQAMVITLIVIEVVIMVVAGGIILSLFRYYKTIDTRKLNQLKG